MNFFSFLFSPFSLRIKNVTKVLKYLKSLLVRHESISSFLIAFLISLFFYGSWISLNFSLGGKETWALISFRSFFLVTLQRPFFLGRKKQLIAAYVHCLVVQMVFLTIGE